MIHGKTLQDWYQQHPLLEKLVALEECSWFNPAITPFDEALPYVGLTEQDVTEASARLQRFAAYFRAVFPETRPAGGLLESPLQAIPRMHQALCQRYDIPQTGTLLIKLDSHLPISGSIKARGGIHEVLKYAEDLAIGAGLLRPDDDYATLDSEAFRAFFGQYAIAVGSTGNLGLSIGLIGAKLGFRTTVHMSADARNWKKRRLREQGVTVVE
ncbi:MAG: D-serine ammonia-lyase, partial [Pseudogulbenkiania sp.]|nr:D-serine ammonia-lyase [Pseudogulbenkiania sp.]